MFIPISYVGYESGSGNNTTSDNFGLPATWSANNIAIFCWYTFDPTKKFTDASGGLITPIGSGSAAAGTGSYFLGYRILQAGDSTFAWTSNSVASSTVVWGTAVFSGSNTGSSPIEAQTSVTTFTNTNDPDPGAVTAVGSGSCIITFFGKMNDYTSIAAPTNYSEGVYSSSTSGNDASMGLAYRIVGAGASQNPAAWTLGGGATTDDGFVWTASITTGSLLYAFSVYSAEDNNTTHDLGTVTFNSTAYASLPSTVNVSAGTYPISYTPSGSNYYSFSTWNTSGSSTITNSGSNSTTITVSDIAGIVARYLVTPPPIYMCGPGLLKW
jgi:hypothetical protein